MTKRNYRELNQSTPGPGTYNANDEVVKARAKSPNLKGTGRND
jgi:Sperm-tail PG-rich repeat